MGETRRPPLLRAHELKQCILKCVPCMRHGPNECQNEIKVPDDYYETIELIHSLNKLLGIYTRLPTKILSYTAVSIAKVMRCFYTYIIKMNNIFNII